MKDTSRPIGIFDSGVGGLTVANAISKLLPDEQLIYFGDTAHLPYGEKSPDALRTYSKRIVEFLQNENCKLIVVACNSAWSSAYGILSAEFDHIVNVVDPVIDIIKDRNYKRIALIATRATIRNGIFSRRIRRLNPDLKVISRSAPLLVNIIEEGYIDDPIGKAVIKNHFQNHEFGDIDALVLACTHFPIIKEAIASYFGPNVDIIDANDAVANSLKKKLITREWQSRNKLVENKFYFSDLTEVISLMCKDVFEGPIEPELRDIWS